MSSEKTEVELAADRYLENIIYFKAFANNGLSKSEIMKLLHYAVEYPLHQKDPNFTSKKVKSIAALIEMLTKDKTILAVNSMNELVLEEKRSQDE